MIKSRSFAPTRLKNVPPFPPIAVKLLALLSDPSVEIREVADLVGTDAVFTARLLQRVNSIEFGLASPVSNIKQAVALLGIDLTRHVVITHAAGVYASGALKTEELRRCWQHMVATAVLADVIAEACGEFRDVAFTAGIMHDIGRLGLLMAYPQEYERVISNATERCMDVLDFEADEFGMHHAEAGRLLAELWGLPQEFAIVTGRHHDPCEGTEVDLVRIVHVACRLAEVLGYDFVRPLKQVDSATVLAELPAYARKSLRLTPAELCGRIETRILEFDSTKTPLPPESSLARLASALEETSQTDSESAAPDSEIAPPTPYESPEDQSPTGKRAFAPRVVLSVLVMVVVVAVLIWKLL